MKRIISVAALFITLQLNAVVVYNGVNFKYTPFVQYACAELGITDVDIYLSTTTKKVQAHVNKTGFGAYIIYINVNECEDYYEVLAHELTHISQDIQGRWNLDNPTVIVSKWGNSYVSDLAREIENEAKASGRKIARSYFKNRKYARK